MCRHSALAASLKFSLPTVCIMLYGTNDVIEVEMHTYAVLLLYLG